MPWPGRASLARPIEPAIAARYVEEVLALRPAIPADRSLRIVYTPMHGVGRLLAERVLRPAGFADLHVVAEQAEPDGRFPTVAFPNPEEPGALDLARALAGRVGADLILANDPDADRLAVCLPREGDWVMLTGNQVGLLLADFLLEHAGPGPTPLVVNSIVSSPMLASIAAAYGARFEATLTGFKWIANAALDLAAAEGTRFVFGYEEALGYTAGPVVRDKDGISAALLFAELTAHCRAVGETVWDRLARLYRRHGLWVSAQRSVVRPGSQGAAEIAAAMELLRRAPAGAPGGRRGDREPPTTGKGPERRPRWLAATPLVALDLGRCGPGPGAPQRHRAQAEDLRGSAGRAGRGGRPGRRVEAAALDGARAVAADLAELPGPGVAAGGGGATLPGHGPGSALEERDRFIDLLRVACIVVVVLGHWATTTVVWEPDRVLSVNALAGGPRHPHRHLAHAGHAPGVLRRGLRQLGVAAADRQLPVLPRRPPGPPAAAHRGLPRGVAGPGARRRDARPGIGGQGPGRRGGRPAVVVPGHLPGGGGPGPGHGGACTAASGCGRPAAWRRRWGSSTWSPSACGVEGVGGANYAFQWLFAHQLGFAYADGTLQRWGRRGAALMAAGRPGGPGAAHHGGRLPGEPGGGAGAGALQRPASEPGDGGPDPVAGGPGPAAAAGGASAGWPAPGRGAWCGRVPRCC